MVEVRHRHAQAQLTRLRVLFAQLKRFRLKHHDLVAAIGMLELALDLDDSILLDGLGVLLVLEADALHMARSVFQVERGHLRAALRQLRHNIGHHSHEHRGLDLLRALG